MMDASQSKDTQAFEISPDPLEAGLAAAFGPDSGHPLPAGASVLKALSASLPAVPRVHLREPREDQPTPVVRPQSSEMPENAHLPDSSSRYQLVGELARGGMGAILKGRDIDLGRDIALKVLLETHQGKSELVQRFLEEAQIAGQLQHPGVIPVYELGQFADRRPYFTMKLVKGKTLSALLGARTEPTEERSKFVGIFVQVCQTLAYAHARGVIHRDLKPSNVMVGAFGEVQVMDWGLAKVLSEGGVADEEKSRLRQEKSVIRTQRSAGSDTPGAGSHTQAGSVLGTPAYMAPEQARGEVDLVDERADVFGLGAILCEILTGEPPFVGKAAEAQRKAQTAQLDDAYARLDGCGAEAGLVGLAKRCLAAEPWHRPHDAGQVAEAVTAYQESVAERLHQAELAHAAEAARAEEARATAAEAEAKARAERRARRLTLALAASVLLAGALGAAGVRWVELERMGRVAALEARINTALQEALRLRGQAQGAALGNLAPWAEAVAAARNAEVLLEPGVNPALRQQAEALLAEMTAEEQQAAAAVHAAERDRRLLEQLVDIRSAKADDREGSATDAAYAEAFRAAGIDVAALPPAEAGAQLRARPAAVAVALATALDDWAAVRRNQRKGAAGAKHLSEVGQLADPDPWRRDLRTTLEQPDRETRLTALRALAKTARLDELGAVSLDLLGKALSDAGDAPAAETVLRAAQRRHSDDVWVNYDLAQVLEKLARREEAIRYYMAARALRPETAHELAHALEAKGESDEAIVVFQELARLRPKNGRHLACLGKALHARGRAQEANTVLDAAVAALHEAIRLRPQDAGPHNTLGMILCDVKHDYEAGLAAFREALRLQPDYATAHRNLGIALANQKKHDEAIAAFREALRLQPDFAKAYVNLGRALAAQGKRDEAIVAFREALRLQPDDAWAHDNLGSALWYQRKYNEAVAAHRQATQLKPDSATYHFNLGNALKEHGELDEAIAAFHEAIRLRPDYAAAHNNLGLTLGRQGKPDEAIAAYREAIRLRPDDARTHNNLGIILCDIKQDYEAAVAAFREAIRLQPDFATAHHNLGLALAYQGKRAEAIAAYHETLRLQPDYARAHCHLGIILRQQGQFAEALASFQRGHELSSQEPGWDLPSAEWVRQAEQLVALAPKLPALLQGQAQPANASERLALGQICFDRKWYVAAARFWLDAFAEDPPLADDLQTRYRYDAARAAALAGAGKAQDIPPPNDATKAQLRQQARAWLQANLVAHAKRLDGEDRQAASQVRRRLVPWKYDPQLAGVRNEDALQKLPAEEQQACRKLWADVEAVLTRAADR